MTAKEMENKFNNNGWKGVRFRELSKEEAKEKGYCFAMYSNKKYFVMIGNGNVYDEKGNIAVYNIPGIPATVI